MPGQVAYTAGANAAQRIIDPSAPEVTIPLPRARPERGEGIPNPRMRPGAEPQPAQWSEADQMTEVDENGNYINQPQPLQESRTKDDAIVRAEPPSMRPRPSASPLRMDENGNPYYGPADVGRSASEQRTWLLRAGVEDGPVLDRMITRLEQGLKSRGNFRYSSGQTAAEIGAMTSDYREVLIGQGVTGEALDKRTSTYEQTLKRIVGDGQRVADASASARGATKQRLSGLVPSSDRFRPRDMRRGDDIERIRTTEAVREYARGIADTYRRVVDRGRTAAAPRPTDPDRQRFITDALLHAAPTPAETVTGAYAFRRRRIA